WKFGPYSGNSKGRRTRSRSSVRRPFSSQFRLPSIVVAHPRMRESDAEQRRYSLPLLFTPVRRLLRHALTPLARRLGARGGRSTISVFTGCTSASDHRDLDREERSPRRGGSRDASSPQPLRRGFHQLLQLAATSSPC